MAVAALSTAERPGGAPARPSSARQNIIVALARGVGRKSAATRGELRHHFASLLSWRWGGWSHNGAALTSLWTNVGMLSLHARASRVAADASATPVVLVHGFGVSSRYFVPTAERLAGEFAVYSPDLPGHGRSSSPNAPLDIPRLADCLIGWMDAMGLERVSLVGNSMGCQIAVDAATRYPDRVERLVLIGPTVDPRARSFFLLAGRLILAGLHERCSLYPILVLDYARMGWRLVPEFRFMIADPIEQKLPHLIQPVMLIRGENDSVVSQRWFHEAAMLARAVESAEIARGSHAVNYTTPQKLVDVILPFLRSARSGDRPTLPTRPIVPT